MSQMQPIILRHLPHHEILLASSILPLYRKIILISRLFSSTSYGLLKNIFPDSPAHTWFPLPGLPGCPSQLPTQLWVSSDFPRAPGPFYRQYIFCCFFEDLVCHIIDLIYMYPHLTLFFFLNEFSNLFIYFFIYLFMAVLGLRFCARAFSSCGKWGPLFIAVRGPLTIAASLVAEHRLQTRRLSNCDSRAYSLHSMWDPPRPGLEPVSPALAGRFTTTAPPGKPPTFDS